MAQFLTFGGKVVQGQKGRGSVIELWFRGQQVPVKVPAAEWNAKKKFEYFDSQKVPRKTAIALYEAAQKQP